MIGSEEWFIAQQFYGATKDEVLKACSSWCHDASLAVEKKLGMIVFDVKFKAPADGKIPLRVFPADPCGATIRFTRFYVKRESRFSAWPISTKSDASATKDAVEYQMSFQVDDATTSFIYDLLRYLPKSHEHRKTVDDIVAEHKSPSGVIADYDLLLADIEQELPIETKKAIVLEQFKQCGHYICQHGIAIN